MSPSINKIASLCQSWVIQILTRLSYTIFILILFLSISNAQKPKLGLVLSGGGAKGIAHVRILKAIEEAGLKPDYIAGTSMGSIIGGLYAIGYSADQIEEIVLNLDWDQILSNNIPMDYISYEEKEYYDRFLLELPIVEGKIEIPSGVIEGQALSEALNHFTWPSMKYKYFDEFPIPFRCVGTDVSTGKEIIFKEGSLADAMRASMAIPTAFSAADLDTTLAVDGGIVNNFPADVLKDMGADIIIGVNVTRGFKSSEEVKSMTGILMQMAMLTSNEKLPEQEKLCDVYIQPYLEDYSNASFNKYLEILKIGEEEAANHKDELDSLAKILGKVKDFPGITNEHESIIISDIEFSGNKLFNDDVVNGKLNINKGDTVEPNDVEEAVRRVYGINGFHKVEYSLSRKDEGTRLKLKMKERSPIILRSSFHYDNTFSAGIVLNIQMRDLLLRSSRTILAADISENPRFRFDYYKYIGTRKRAALNLRYNFFKEQRPVYTKGEISDVETNVENSLSFTILSTQSLKNSVFVGMDYEANRFKSQYFGFTNSGLEYADNNFLKINFGYIKNSLNSQNYPTKGSEKLIIITGYAQSEYKAHYTGDSDTLTILVRDDDSPLELRISKDDFSAYLTDLTPDYYANVYLRSTNYVKLRKNFQLLTEINAGILVSFDSAGNLYNRFLVGGHQQVKIQDTKFMGLKYAEKDFENFLSGGLYLQNVLFRNFYLVYGANLLYYYDHVPIGDISSFDLNRMINDQYLFGYGGELTYKSFIGPISFGLTSNTDDGYVRYHLSLGYSFNYRD